MTDFEETERSYRAFLAQKKNRRHDDDEGSAPGFALGVLLILAMLVWWLFDGP
jgi:hypothetical protein